MGFYFLYNKLCVARWSKEIKEHFKLFWNCQDVVYCRKYAEWVELNIHVMMMVAELTFSVLFSFHHIWELRPENCFRPSHKMNQNQSKIREKTAKIIERESEIYIRNQIDKKRQWFFMWSMFLHLDKNFCAILHLMIPPNCRDKTW